ncbi:LysM peptidoglycan-binding domain-containing protein [Magnetospirillum molischianum]|uniref:LysM peptidoglycan-binding domain-containing protein n=1 Tax=Magnetospirillum molischianum TaxID=1083 RepID=UPI00058E1BB1|nr:LysM peptidoglycan-binding domain-containing protein [Magnetospirillum molischianum]
MTRPTLVALFGLAVAIVAALLAFQHEREEAAPTVPTPTTAPTAAPIPDARRPSFDVVRIGTEGNSVIAGRAQPGAQVIILDGGTELGRVIADPRGEWVFVPAKAMPPGGRELRLRAVNPDGEVLESGDPVVLVVPERGTGSALALKTAPTGGTTLLQGPVGLTDGALSLDLVDHDDKGRLFISGKAPTGSRIHLYIDDRFIGRAEADADGGWRIAGSRPTGDSHLLRADLVDAKGKVLARIETPWTPGTPLARPGAGEVVVSPGTSLWRIARRVYGEGIAYTAVFTANRDRISNPDLIYPGQVFILPQR